MLVDMPFAALLIGEFCIIFVIINCHCFVVCLVLRLFVIYIAVPVFDPDCVMIVVGYCVVDSDIFSEGKWTYWWRVWGCWLSRDQAIGNIIHLSYPNGLLKRKEKKSN